MRPEASPERVRVSPAMRKSILQLQDKSRWIRRVAAPGQEARPPRKRRSDSPPARRTLSTIVKDYKKALARLDNIETELAEWLSAPLAGASPSDADALQAEPCRTTDDPVSPSPTLTEQTAANG